MTIRPLNILVWLAPLALTLLAIGGCQPVSAPFPIQAPSETLESTVLPTVPVTPTQASSQSELYLPVIPQSTGSPNPVQAVDDLPRTTPTSVKIALEHLAAMLEMYPEDIYIAKTVPTDANFAADGCVQIKKLGDQSQALPAGLLLFLEGKGGLYRYHITTAQVSFCGQVE